MGRKIRSPIEPVYGAIGKRIKFVRETRGMFQRDLAKRTGVALTTLFEIENGKGRFMLHTLMVIADALETSPEYLLKGVWK